MKKILAIVMLGMCFLTPVATSPVRAQGIPVYDNANFLQNVLTAINTVRSVLNQVRQIKMQIEQVRMQIQALKRLGAPTWRNLGAYLAGIEAVLIRGEALTATALNMDEFFRATFPAFSVPEDALVPAAVKKRIMTGLESVRSNVHAARAHYAQFRAAQLELDALKRSLAGAEGHQMALETIAMTGAYAAEETMLLRQAVLQGNMLLAQGMAMDLTREAEQIVLRDRMHAGIRAISAGGCGSFRISDLVVIGGSYGACAPFTDVAVLPSPADYPAYALYAQVPLGEYGEPDWGAWGEFLPPEFDDSFDLPLADPPGGGPPEDEGPDEEF